MAVNAEIKLKNRFRPLSTDKKKLSTWQKNWSEHEKLHADTNIDLKSFFMWIKKYCCVLLETFKYYRV